MVIAPVESVSYKGTKIVPQKPNGELSVELYKKLQDIQVFYFMHYSTDVFLIHSHTWLTNLNHSLDHYSFHSLT